MLPPQCGARRGWGALLAPVSSVGCTTALPLRDLHLNLAAVWEDQVGFLGPGLRAEAQHPTWDSWTRACRPALPNSPTPLGWAARTWGGEGAIEGWRAHRGPKTWARPPRQGPVPSGQLSCLSVPAHSPIPQQAGAISRHCGNAEGSPGPLLTARPIVPAQPVQGRRCLGQDPPPGREHAQIWGSATQPPTWPDEASARNAPQVATSLRARHPGARSPSPQALTLLGCKVGFTQGCRSGGTHCLFRS